MKAQKGTRRVGHYGAAIEWIALNDDTLWLDDPDGSTSVTLCLVADIFGRTVEEAEADLRRAIAREKRNAERSKRAQEGLKQARATVRRVLDKS